MTDTPDVQDAAGAAMTASSPAPPISSRFLFVDVAAQRAKQLRRGALPRLSRPVSGPLKLERLAMDEVREGLIQYELPSGFDGAGRGDRG